MEVKRSKKKKKGSSRGKGKDIISTSQDKVKEEKKESVKRWYILFALIAAVTLISYFNSLNNQFVFDDIHVILNNPTIKGIEKIPGLLGIGKRRVSYRLIRMVSYAIDYTLNKKVWGSAGGYENGDIGLNPLGYHISNIAYHIVTSLLVFLVVYSLVANYRIALLAASLFALHPVHTDHFSYRGEDFGSLYEIVSVSHQAQC